MAVTISSAMDAKIFPNCLPYCFRPIRFSAGNSGTDYEGVNELQGRVFPSSERRGGCAIKKMLRSLLMKAQTGWSVPDNVSTSTFTIMTTPSAPLRRLRVFFLLAQPPLLFQEGNTLSWQFVHTFYDAATVSFLSQSIRPRPAPWVSSWAAPGRWPEPDLSRPERGWSLPQWRL